MSELGDALRAEAGECEDYGTRALLPDLAARADALEVEHVHAVADLVEENGRMRRTVREVSDLLADALHALRNGRPDVTDEFIDRSLSRLARLVNPETRG